MLSKLAVFKILETFIEEKTANAYQILNEAKDSLYSETKGSAGDKHETGRAMAQIEVDKAGRFLDETQQLKAILPLLKPDKSRRKCETGALVETTQGFFYLSIGIGKLLINEHSIFCVSIHSPIGQSLLHKVQGDKYKVGNNEFEILEIN
jgi:hypothetical protein